MKKITSITKSIHLLLFGKFYPALLALIFFICLSGLENVQAQQPTVTSFTPTSGPTGSTVVTITGTNFNTTAANNVVFFGAATATVSAATATSLTVTVPTGATYAPISVMNTASNLQVKSADSYLPTFSPNKGDITAADFEPVYNFSSPRDGSTGAVGDFDGDGLPDIVVQDQVRNQSRGKVSVYRNTSTIGSFTPTNSFEHAGDFQAGSRPTHVVVGDIDGDGKLDLAVANYASFSPNTSVSVFRNNSSGPGNISFEAEVRFNTTYAYAIAIGDLNNDGKPDLVVGSATQFMNVLKNTSVPGTLSFEPRVLVDAGVTLVYGLAISDLDGDGWNDVAVVNYYSSQLSILRNTSTGVSVSSFDTPVVFSTPANPNTVTIGDIDGDGKPDVITTNTTGNSISVFRNAATSGSFTSTSFDAKVDYALDNGYHVAASIGDMDGDGKPDVVVGGFINYVSILRNTATSGIIDAGSFAPKVIINTTTSGTPLIADFDGDGKPDIVSSWQLGILRNNPQGLISTYQLTVNATNGTVALNPATGPYAANSTVTLTPTADLGYDFAGWSGDVPTGDVNNNPLILTMDADKTVTATFTISCTAPTITCPGNQAANTASNSCDAAVTYSSSPTTTGTAPVDITYTFTGATTGSGTGYGSGSIFNKGTTTVTLTANNACGNQSCSFDVIVSDNEVPVFITQPGIMDFAVWPPNHQYETFTLEDFIVSVSDNCAGDIPLENVTILSAASDEPENSDGTGDGNTLDDMIIDADCQTIQLRKEREGGGNGRVYTIIIAVDDGNGNFATATAQVEVPHSNNGTAIDDGMAYEVECNKSSFVSFTGDDFQLMNYPNPFNSNTTIAFSLTETENTTLKVYDTFGKEVATLFDGMAESGQEYKFEFSSGNLSKGIYIYHLQSGNNVSVLKKMILMK